MKDGVKDGVGLRSLERFMPRSPNIRRKMAISPRFEEYTPCTLLQLKRLKEVWALRLISKRTTTLSHDGRVDAHIPALEIEQRVAAVPRVDGCLGLNEMVVRASPDNATLSAHDPLGAQQYR